MSYKKKNTIKYNNIALTWSQADDALALHALPTAHSTNIPDASYATSLYSADYSNNVAAGNGGYDWHNHYEDLTADDGDFAMDFGDFIF